MKYTGSYIINYKLKALTGLRVGGSKEEFDIGGTDNPVMKVPADIPDYYGENRPLPKGAPYIPGSSIKGKMRSLLEWVYGRVEDNITSEEALKVQKKVGQAKRAYEEALRKGNIEEINRAKKNFSDAVEEYTKVAGRVCSCGKCPVCIVFGIGEIDTYKELLPEEQPGPPRAKFFDLYPTEETLSNLQEALGRGIFTEIKTENQINRITSRANPRKVERVPAGAVFEGTIVFDCYKEGDENLLKVVLQGMQKLEDNFLGGYGSRGSGRIKFEDIEIRWRPAEFYKSGTGEEVKGKFSTLMEAMESLGEIKG